MTDASTQFALVAQIDDVQSRARRLARGYEIRSMTESDGDALAELYFRAYGPDVVATRDDAEAELTRTFAGEYGRVDVDASSTITQCALRWSADRLASTGAGTMALFVMSDNTAARALYAKLGFVPWRARDGRTYDT